MSNRHRELFDEAFIARLERLRLVAKRMVAAGQGGSRRSLRMGDGQEFADHRDYAPGDDVRFVDWPYYARMEKLLLRLFHEHSDARVAILLDVSGSMNAGQDGGEKLNYALRTAAALAFVAMAGLDRVALQPFADDLRNPMNCGRDQSQLLSVLEYLSQLQAGGRTDLGQCLHRFARASEAPGTALIITDLLDCSEDLSDGLALLAGRNWQTTLVHLVSPADAEPPIEGASELESAETGDRMTVDVTPDLRHAYRRTFEDLIAGARRTCSSRGATYVSARTDQPFERLVLHTLRRSRVLTG